MMECKSMAANGSTARKDPRLHAQQFVGLHCTYLDSFHCATWKLSHSEGCPSVYSAILVQIAVGKDQMTCCSGVVCQRASLHDGVN